MRLDDKQLARFMVKVEKTETCWLWTAAKMGKGYGLFRVASRPRQPSYAHRVAYEHFVGDIPEGHHIDHLCRTPHCVNPEHLEPVTPRENQRRGLKGVLTTHCPHGHPYDEANTYWYQGRWRDCRACAREAERAKAARKRMEAAA